MYWQTSLEIKWISYIYVFYNIASRAAQSNSVYVRVLKISIVLADGVSKFFLSAWGKMLYFATIMVTNRDSTH